MTDNVTLQKPKQKKQHRNIRQKTTKSTGCIGSSLRCGDIFDRVVMRCKNMKR
eukprot:CAMPEP_0119566018 /NCGR_PEP_ID=MMETSP1352-20130426/31838_1 /TAXON_ID=265584 /ORGANISM="Stauroneis constricta, Strain CCMP1120" /LENGTH=52 /DNA_ID=CAMNT_0007615057 /DNA_START=64 /DNA_END=219 /DNA_ORIENTATION=+